MSGSKLEVIDIDQYSFLTDEDQCACWGRYHARKGFSGGQINQIIVNIKKDPSKAGQHDYHYKQRDIEKVGKYFSSNLRHKALNDQITLVPIPPSKTRNHPEYDDRMLRICNETVRGLASPEVIDLLKTNKSLKASHTLTSGNRTSLEDLKANLALDIPANFKPRPIVLLVDDVLTTGRHFAACKYVIKNHFPNAQVMGLFIGRVDHQLSYEEAISGFDIEF